VRFLCCILGRLFASAHEIRKKKKHYRRRWRAVKIVTYTLWRYKTRANVYTRISYRGRCVCVCVWPRYIINADSSTRKIRNCHARDRRTGRLRLDEYSKNCNVFGRCFGIMREWCSRCEYIRLDGTVGKFRHGHGRGVLEDGQFSCENRANRIKFNYLKHDWFSVWSKCAAFRVLNTHHARSKENSKNLAWTHCLQKGDSTTLRPWYRARAAGRNRTGNRVGSATAGTFIYI